MSQKFKNFNQFYRSVNLIYMSILISFLFTMTLFYALTKEHTFNFAKVDSKILYPDLLFGFIIFWGSGHIKKKLQNLASKKSNIKEKLPVFLKYYLINLAIVDFYGLLNSIGYFLTHNFVFMFFGAYALLLLLLMKPKPEKMAYLLSLSPEEEDYFNESLKSIE